MKLSEFLTRKIKVLSPQDSVQKAGDQMREHGAANLPVAEERRLVGMVDQPDPDLQASRHGHDPARIRVGDAMNSQAACCQETDDCESALALMDASGLDHLPIVDKDMGIVGVVQRHELIALLERSSGEQ